MKRRCKTVKRHLTLRRSGVHLDTELSKHLDACEDCRRVLRSNQALWDLLGEYKAPSLDIDLLSGVERQLEMNRRRSIRGRVAAWIATFMPRPVFASTALALVGLIIGAWMGTMLVMKEDTQTVTLSAVDASESYAAIFEPSPPGFLSATDLWDSEGRNIP